MTTKKLYYEDSHLTTFEAQVLSCEPDGKFYQIILDATAFFPEGGGQAADTGKLILHSCGSPTEMEPSADSVCSEQTVQVLDVQEKQDIIYHKTNAPLPPGTVVTGELNWSLRFDRMQQHSGEHLISGLIHARYGYDNVGFHLGDQEVTLDFNGVLTKEELMEIEWDANLAIAKNFPVQITYPSKEELADLDYRSKIEIWGQVRIVTFEGYDVCACCAPHVDRTGEIGQIKITHVQNHRGGIRVNILCGLRALKDYREKSESVNRISVLLSAKESLTADAVSRLKEEQFALNGRLMALQGQILKQELEQLPAGSKDVLFFFQDLDANAVREFVNQLMKRCTGYCAAFFGSDETGYKYIIGSATKDIRPLGKALNDALQGRGGGKPEMIQGSVHATQEEIRRTLISCPLC